MNRSLALVALHAIATTAVAFVLTDPGSTVTVITGILGLVMIGATLINGSRH